MMNAKPIAHFYLAAMIVLSVYSQLIMKWRICGCFAGLKLPEGILPKIGVLLIVVGVTVVSQWAK